MKFDQKKYMYGQQMKTGQNNNRQTATQWGKDYYYYGINKIIINEINYLKQDKERQ